MHRKHTGCCEDLPTAVCHPTSFPGFALSGAAGADSRGFAAQPLALARAALSSGLFLIALPAAALADAGLPGGPLLVPVADEAMSMESLPNGVPEGASKGFPDEAAVAAMTGLLD